MLLKLDDLLLKPLQIEYHELPRASSYIKANISISKLPICLKQQGPSARHLLTVEQMSVLN